MFGVDDAIIASLGSAAIGSIGSMFGASSANTANRDIAREANASNTAMNRENLAFQERMSNTSWQRGVEDMRKAGVNPMLAFSKGGASTPGGSAIGAVTGAPQQNIFHGVPSAVSNALAVYRAKQDLENMRLQGDVLRSQATLNAGSARKVLADSQLTENLIPKSSIKSTFYDMADRALKSSLSSASDVARHASLPKSADSDLLNARVRKFGKLGVRAFFK